MGIHIKDKIGDKKNIKLNKTIWQKKKGKTQHDNKSL